MTATPLPDLEVVKEGAAAPLSEEVLWYLESRGYEIPTKQPLWRTPEPINLEGARFNPDRVDKVIKAVEALRHTKGRWAGKPLRLEPVQIAYFVAPIFGWEIEDSQGDWVRVYRSVWIEMPRKGAKALDVATPILTTDGWSTIGDLEPGKAVYGPDGAPTVVTHVSDIFSDHRCFEVTTTDGRTVIADEDHLWTVRDRRIKRSRGRDPWKTMTTGELVKAGLTKGQARTELRYSLPRQHALDLHGVDLDIDPYLLGYWLGDGLAASGRLIVGDQDLEAVLDIFGDQVAKVARYKEGASRLRMEGLQVKLRSAGLLGNKHIPQEYLLSSYDQRLALLRGLMDSDGTASQDRNRVSFCTIREELANQVMFLVRSLGFRPHLIKGTAKLYGREISDSFRVSWAVSNEDPIPFRLPRKADRLVWTSRDDRRFTVSIQSIREVPSRKTRCIMVDREDGLFLAGEDLMVTHNSTLAGAFSFYLGFADGEGGAEVLLGAGSKDQARIAYQPLKELVDGSPSLRNAGIKATRTSIEKRSTGSFLKAVSSRGDLAHGANVHGGLVDELHVHKSPDLLEAIETGTGARSQPMVIIITTADDGSTTSVYAQRRNQIERICLGALEAPNTYGVIFAMPKDGDPFDEKNWDNANPLYPVTPSPEYMRQAAQRAKGSDVELASFLRLHLGVRSDKASRYFNIDRWKLGNHKINEAKLTRAEAYGGIDLGSVSDLTALSWLFPKSNGSFECLVRFWLPSEALKSLDARTQRQASSWVRQGFITLTPGDVTDYGYIKKQVIEDMDKFDVVQIGYDRWNATQLVNELEEEQAPMVRVQQSVVALSPVLKEMNRLILLNTPEKPMFSHGGNPVLSWMADNLRIREDPNGNLAPDKSTSMDKIDGISATLNALSVYLSTVEMTSAYEGHRLEVV